MAFLSVLYTIIIYPLVQIVGGAFIFAQRLFDITGLSVIFVSVVITILCLPLYDIAEKWQKIERDTQTRLKSGVDRIKSVFKGDEQYMLLTTYYRQNHYHPMMALRSSFGLLIQIPFFMAAYSCLSTLPMLQGESFLFIRDMGKPDALFSIGSFSVNILPIAMTAINCAAGAVYTKGFSLREKMQIYIMALVFLVLLYNSPSGLVLYWTMNNIFSLVKNIFYKLKNPLKALYVLVCIGIVCVYIFVLITYRSPVGIAKRIVSLAVLFFVPLLMRLVNFILEKPLAYIVKNSRERFLLFLFSAVSLVLLSGLVLPSELISSSVQEFSNIGSYTNPVFFLSDSFFQSVGFYLFWPLCVYFLFDEKVQTFFAVIFSVLFFSSIANVYLFPGNYGSMETTLKFIGKIRTHSVQFLIINLLVSVAIVILLFIFFNFNKTKIIFSATVLTSCVFVVLSVANVAKINCDYNDFEKILSRNANNKNSDVGDTYIHLSKSNRNVFVLMIDAASVAYFESIMQDRPDICREFSGFKLFKNTVSYNNHTLIGVPPVFGGYEYTPAEINKRDNISLKTKHNEAALMLGRVFSEQADFDVMLSDLSWGNYSYISDMSFTDEYDKINGVNFNGRFVSEFKKEFSEEFDTQSGIVDLQKSIKRNLIWVSFFRQVPAIARAAVYYEGTWWSIDQAKDASSLYEFINMFPILYYMDKTTDLHSPRGNFILMTNDSLHGTTGIDFLNLLPPNSMSHGYLKGYDTTTAVWQALGNWFGFLRANDAYDNTRIIIVSDHGDDIGLGSSSLYDTLDGTTAKKTSFNPILLFKDFDSNDELQTDMTFMTNADVPTLALSGVVENPINPFTGNAINDDAKDNGVLITIDDIFMPYHSHSKNIFTVKDDSWYRVRDNIFLPENWKQEKQ